MRNEILHALRHYRNDKAEWEIIQMKLREEEVIDAVQTAATFPYSKHTAYVRGVPETRTTIQLRKRARELRKSMRIATQFMNSLPQERLRLAVRLKFMQAENRKWEDVAFLVGYTSGGEALRQVIIREAKKRTFRTDSTF